MASVRKNYRFHPVVIEKLDYLMSIGRYATETDAVVDAIFKLERYWVEQGSSYVQRSQVPALEKEKDTP